MRELQLLMSMTFLGHLKNIIPLADNLMMIKNQLFSTGLMAWDFCLILDSPSSKCSPP